MLHCISMSFIQHTYAKKLAQRQSAQSHVRHFVNMEPTVYFSRWSIAAARCVISCPSWPPPSKPTALRAEHSIGDIGVTRLYVRPKGVWVGSAREDVGWHEIEICWMILPGIELQTELEMMDMFPSLGLRIFNEWAGLVELKETKWKESRHFAWRWTCVMLLWEKYITWFS